MTDPEITVRDVALFILNADQRDMNVIEQSFKARRNVLKEERRLELMSSLYVGTKVYLNGNVSPKMLEWKSGVIVKIEDDGHFAIRLDSPPSVKWGGIIRCTIDQLDIM